ncbi:MAG: hypothetical protein ABIQ16_02930 [Polyangiaceae bacterium]
MAGPIARISGAEIAHFPFIWATVLVLTALVGRWLARRQAGATGFRDALARALSDSARRRDWPFLAAFGVALAAYIFLIFYKDDFADYDDDIFTSFSLRGKNHSPPIWPNEGRFFPLAHQEFNVLRLLTRSIVGYHLFAVTELIALLALVFLLLRELRAPLRLAVMTAVLITPSFVIAYSAFSYPERNVILLLALLAFLVQCYDRWRSPAFFVCALLVVHCVLYFKEPIFVAISAFAGTRLVLGWLQLPSQPIGTRLRRLARAHALDLGMLTLSSIFVLLLALAFLPHHGSGYANKIHAGDGSGMLGLVLAYAKIDVIVVVFVAVFVARVVGLWRARQLPDPVWDALAVGGLAYAAVVLVLRAYSAYYMAPTDFIGLLYLAWVAARTRRVALVAIFASMIAVQSFLYSYFVVAERKNTIQAKVQLAEFLLSLHAHGVRQTRLFLPYSIPFRMMDLAAFLDYKGLAVPAEDSPTLMSKASVVLQGPQDFPGGRCVEYRPYSCAHADAPVPGDLIVLLPDDTLPPGTVSSLAQRDELVFARAPVGVPRAALPFFSLLRADSSFFSDRPLPPEWLELRVFVAR